MQAVRLLAEVGDEQSLDVVLEVLRQDGGCLDYHFGDYLVETFVPVVAKLGVGHLDKLMSYAKEPGLYDYAHNLVMEAVCAIYVHNPELREEAKEWFERSARSDAWTQTRVGLLFYYEYEDHEAGKAFLSSAAEQGYEPAREVLRSIEQGLNARIVIGVCDLFYYAGNILDERSEDMYSQEHTIDYHGIDKKQRCEDQAKRQGIIMY